MLKEAGKNGRNGPSARPPVVQDPELELVLAQFMGNAKEVLQKLVFAKVRIAQVNIQIYKHTNIQILRANCSGQYRNIQI